MNISADRRRFLPMLADSVKKAVVLFSVPGLLDDGMASDLLMRAGYDNHPKPEEVVSEFKKSSVWHNVVGSYWTIDSDVRSEALSLLNGSSARVVSQVFDVLSGARNKLATHGEVVLKDLDFQINRLGLKLQRALPQSSQWFRNLWDASDLFRLSESKRIIVTYIDEARLAPEGSGSSWPEHVLSLWFVQGKYYYDLKDYDQAIHFLSPVWKHKTESSSSVKDAAVAAHFLGRIYSNEERSWGKARKFLLSSIHLGKFLEDDYHLAHVYNTLGNLISRTGGEKPSAEKCFKEAIRYSGGDENILRIVYYSYGRYLFFQKRYIEAREMFNSSLLLEHDQEYIYNINDYISSIDRLAR